MIAVISTLKFNNELLRIAESDDSYLVQELIEVDPDLQPEFRTILRKQKSQYGLEHCKLFVANHFIKHLQPEHFIAYAV